MSSAAIASQQHDKNTSSCYFAADESEIAPSSHFGHRHPSKKQNNNNNDDNKSNNNKKIAVNNQRLQVKPQKRNLLPTFKMNKTQFVFINQLNGEQTLSTNPDPQQHCVCTVCFCGQHSCPHSTEKIFGPTPDSEYRQSYCPHAMDRCRHRATPLTPSLTICPKGHFLTTNARDFVPMSCHKSHQDSSGGQLQPDRRNPFDANSTHRTDYVKYPNHEAIKSMKQIPVIGGHISFDGKSMSHADYQDWCKTAKRPERFKDNREANAITPFDATTTNRAEFVAPPTSCIRPPSCAPMPYASPLIKFENNSEYQRNYDTKEIITCPARLLPIRTPCACTGHVHWLYKTGCKLADPASYDPAIAKLPGPKTSSSLTTTTNRNYNSSSEKRVLSPSSTTNSSPKTLSAG